MGARPGVILLLLLAGCRPVSRAITTPGGAGGPAGWPERPEVQARVMEGWARQAGGDDAGAKLAFDAAVREDPSAARARAARATFLAPTDAAAAHADLTEALDHQPDDGAVQWALARIDHDAAALARARQLGVPAAWTAGWDGSLSYASEWQAVPLTAPADHLARARALAEVGDHDNAVDDALAALPFATDGAAAVLAGSAPLAWRTGAALDALLTLRPTSELARTALVTLCKTADDPVRTLEALALFPEHGGTDDVRELLRVDALGRSGRFEEALAVADDALHHHAGWGEMLRAKARVQLLGGAPRTAAATLGEPIIGPWQPLHTLWKARALVAAKDGPGALAAVEADQWHDNDSVQMAYALVLAGAAAGSPDAMERGAVRLPVNTRIDAYAEAGQVDRALELLSPDDPIQVERAAKLLAAAGRTAEAEARLDAASTRWPERARLWSMLGRIRDREPEMTVALSLDPLDHDAIAWLAAHGRDEAAARIPRLLDRWPGDPELLSALGAWHAGRGEPLQAVPAYEAALSRAPTDPALRAALIALYTQLGDTDAAERTRLVGLSDDKPKPEHHASRHRSSRHRSSHSSRRTSRKRKHR